MPRLFFHLLVLLTVLAGCSRTDPSPSSPSSSTTPRVVALSPAIAALMLDAGLDPLIVGRHAWDIALPKTIPSCGEQGTIDYEALLHTQPTHVLLQWGRQDLPARLTDLAASRAIIIENVDILSLDEIDRAQRRLAELLSPATPFDPARLTSARIDAVRAAHPNLNSRGRILLIAASGATYGVLGPGSCHAQVLDRLGIQNAMSTGGPWANLDAEDIVALRPDAIVLIQPRAWNTSPRRPSIDELRTTLGVLGRVDTPAVATARLGFIDDPLALIPSASMAQFAADLATIIDAWQGPYPTESTSLTR